MKSALMGLNTRYDRLILSIFYIASLFIFICIAWFLTLKAARLTEVIWPCLNEIPLINSMATEDSSF